MFEWRPNQSRCLNRRLYIRLLDHKKQLGNRFRRQWLHLRDKRHQQQLQNRSRSPYYLVKQVIFAFSADVVRNCPDNLVIIDKNDSSLNSVVMILKVVFII